MEILIFLFMWFIFGIAGYLLILHAHKNLNGGVLKNGIGVTHLVAILAGPASFILGILFLLDLYYDN
jgi:hypothetical protein